jgi:hypothetical protein
VSTHGANVWVVRKGGNWAVVEEGRKTPLITSNTQRGAIRVARLVAKDNRGELIVTNRRGEIRSKDSHGSDSPYRDG